MRVEIIYMDRTKDAEEFVCEEFSEYLKTLEFTNVTHPFKAKRVMKNLDDVDYYVEYEEEE